MTRCPVTVFWWDLSMRARCLLAGGHDGPHRDGTRWFDDYGYQQPSDPVGDTPDRTATRIIEGAA